MRSIRYTSLMFCIALFTSQILFAQSANITLIDNINNYPANGYTDCWGYVAPDGREYALQGVNGGVMIVDVTDLDSISEVEFVDWVVAGWYDIKTYQEYMYVSSEGSNDVIIVDISTLPDSATIADTLTGFPTRPHNIYIDQQAAILYVIEDFNFDNPVSLYSLSDPLNPTLVSQLGSGLGIDAHDLFAADSILYVAEGSNPTIGIFDVSDPAAPSLLQRVTIPAAGYVHNVWVSEDKNYMMTTEETVGQSVKMWDISDLNNVTLLDEYLGESQLAHNVFIIGGYAYMSHYEAGIKILDISDPSDIAEVAFYDSYPAADEGNFNGAWGIYPFAQNGKIFIGDIQTGAYVVEFDSVSAGTIEGTVMENVLGGATIADVELSFLEARKTVYSDSTGAYTFRTFEGEHTIVVSRIGWYSDTLNVTITAGGILSRTITLDANLAAMAFSSDSLSAELQTDSTLTTEFVVTNNGPLGSQLDYTIKDVFGPVITKNLQYPKGIIRGDLMFNANLSETPRAPYLPVNLSESSTDTVLIDPGDDLLFGSGGEIVAIYANVGDATVTLDFEFAEDVNADSAYLLFAVDTDFDVNTGAFPGAFGQLFSGQTTGSEFDVFVTAPAIAALGSPALNISIWAGANSAPSSNPLFNGTAQINGKIFSVPIPLSALGNDEGNFAIAGFGGHIIPEFVNVNSLDLFPDVGNVEIGINPLADLPWLSLSAEGGSLAGGESDTITVTYDATGIDESSVVTGEILITSNDAALPITALPVTLQVESPVTIEPGDLIIDDFALFQNYPNPFNPETRIEFTMKQQQQAELAIYNILGQRVRLLVDEVREAGKHTVSWNGLNDHGEALASGLYFYSLKTGSFTETRRMILLR